MASVVDRLRGRDIRRSPDRFLFNGQEHLLGSQVPSLSLDGSPVEVSFENFADAVRTVHSRSGVVAAAVAARALLVSQLVFRFRPVRDPGRLFGTEALSPLETPGQDLTRQSLLWRVEQDVAYAGNAYVRRLDDGRLRHLRPDWMQLLIGSNERPGDPRLGADAEVIGYTYKPGGARSDKPGQILGLSEVAHFAPEPHPLSNFIGESWVTAIWREVAADLQATDHVSKFFGNAATPSMVAMAPPGVVTPEQFSEWVDAFEGSAAGVANAWRTLYIQSGTDVKVVGSPVGDLGLGDLQGGFETRVSVRSRVPAVVLGIREGLAGSALNSGNYAQTRRLWADGWFTPYAQSLCASAERLVNVPQGAELTFDPDRIMFLQEDQADAADIMSKKMATVAAGVQGGFEPQSVVDAIVSGDLSRMVHTGLYSVQLQPAGADQTQRADVNRMDVVHSPDGSVHVHPAVVNVTNHVPVPAVHVPAARVEVTNDVKPAAITNQVNPTPVNVAAPQIDVHVPPERRVTHKVVRDKDGKISKVVDD